MARRKTRKRRTQRDDNYPGWVWMLFGLAIGLSVAFAIYMKDRQPITVADPELQQPASMTASIEETTPVEPVEPEPTAEEPAENRFDFYDMLPNFEVIIPEQEGDVSRDTEDSAIEQPGVYVLQAGSFREFTDADRRRAQLALQGVESHIQRVSIDDKTYHRVRVGPIDDLDRLNNIRNRLRQAQIDVIRIRLGD